MDHFLLRIEETARGLRQRQIVLDIEPYLVCWQNYVPFIPLLFGVIAQNALACIFALVSPFIGTWWAKQNRDGLTRKDIPELQELKADYRRSKAS